MKMNKIAVLAASAALVAVLGLAGCSSQQPAEEAAPAPETAAPAEQADTTSASTPEPPAPTESKPATEESAPAADTATDSSAAASAQDSYIGDDAAKQAALGDAGLAEGDVTELKCELDADDATPHYDVEFKAGGMEYDYDIDAATGAVLVANSEPEVDDGDDD